MATCWRSLSSRTFWSMLSCSTSRPTSSVIECRKPARSSGVSLSGGDHPVHEDLDVDLVVGAVHAGRVVDGVGVEDDRPGGRLDPPALGHAQVAALADHLDPQFVAVDPDGVVGLVAHLGVAIRWRPSHRCRCRRCTAGPPVPAGWPAAVRAGSCVVPAGPARGTPGPARRPEWTWPAAGRPRRRR